ncbi:LOW QUALITY PROTEIN: retinoic acid receptor RXR-alpha-B-like [Sphaerodactylus townsendi]|uniref:LOW QUALITY PROTEIN: retinoic acid receptor RXR-alpha-B-like n=1 Tax=Sphaerodactylus townsendi TaxID=933632 RepID=UPI002026E4C6|nr:LOW QUALITY PROTEIN: retinoic acid receptor RXR-alpha-B-like [Sphaerodactylus townsendi]
MSEPSGDSGLSKQLLCLTRTQSQEASLQAVKAPVCKPSTPVGPLWAKKRESDLCTCGKEPRQRPAGEELPQAHLGWPTGRGRGRGRTTEDGHTPDAQVSPQVSLKVERLLRRLGCWILWILPVHTNSSSANLAPKLPPTGHSIDAPAWGKYSCGGCKNFFKRAISKDLIYNCRDNKNCLIEKCQRNRCQYCRYQKCLAMGMKREAVQEERQRSRERGENEAEASTPSKQHPLCNFEDMPVERILVAEMGVEPRTWKPHSDINKCWISTPTHYPVTNICRGADKQLFTLVEWAKRIPHFSNLTLEDQFILLRAGRNELLIASFSHRSVSVQDGILLATGLHVYRSSAHSAGVGSIFDRILTELVSKMKEMQMDKSELGCLRAIVLFNPDAKGLSSPAEVELLQEKVYAALEAYTKQKYPEQPGRFAKLLLRLPALRSIGLKCGEHLCFFKLIGDTAIDTILMEMLETPLQIT